MQATLRCPFLARQSLNDVKNGAGKMLGMAKRCPVISQYHVSRSQHSSVASNAKENETPCMLARFNRQEKLRDELKDILEVYGGDIAHGCPMLTANGISKTPTLYHETAPLSVQLHEFIRKTTPPTTMDNILASADKFDYENFCQAKLDEKRSDHSYRVFRKVNRRAEAFPVAEEHTGQQKAITVWCSNDYLGMSWHPKVKEAVVDAVMKHGAGAGGTRNISGNTIYHEELERALAIHHKKEAALLFTSCYVANETTLYTLARLMPGCHLLSDAGNHASMIQGVRNSGVPKHIFKHNNPKDLEKKLQKIDVRVPKIVAFESVHSMTGAVCTIKEMCDVAHKYGALTFIDEVHAVGMYGKHGAGVGERDDCLDDMDIITATLGKAFGNIGGYIATTSRIADTVRSYGSGFIFTTSLPPTVLAGSLASLKVVRSEEGQQLRQKHQENVAYLRGNLIKEGIPVIHCPSHIIPVHVGNPEICRQLAEDMLFKHNIYVQAINYPTVARGEEKLRIAPTPHHSTGMMDKWMSARESLAEWSSIWIPYRSDTAALILREKTIVSPMAMQWLEGIHKHYSTATHEIAGAVLPGTMKEAETALPKTEQPVFLWQGLPKMTSGILIFGDAWLGFLNHQREKIHSKKYRREETELSFNEPGVRLGHRLKEILVENKLYMVHMAT